MDLSERDITTLQIVVIARVEMKYQEKNEPLDFTQLMRENGMSTLVQSPFYGRVAP